ncbi:MAG: Trk system potassium transporter TrkA [Bacteroidaceae bacterium]|nr:Trk system potassium transporter TrkA [Bacteroidaceae bacterium]
MKIIIAGAGNVGTHLAKLLSVESQDIVLIDDSEDRLGQMGSSFDLLTIQESPVSIDGLREAGTGSADLFVAVTPDESTNLISCQIAHSLGAKKTLARIDNGEYLNPKNMDFFQKTGIDSLIYPELLAAQEIVNGLKVSWIRQWWEFAGGLLVLMGIKIRLGAEILDRPLRELGPGQPFHIVAIMREGNTIIPSGDDMVLAGDLVYFMTMKKEIRYIQRIAGKQQLPDVKDVIIMGGSRIAVRAAHLIPDHINLKIIESDLAQCHRLTELVDGRAMIINGDGRDPSLLMSEGISHTEAFVALTDNSETNILACLAAKRFGVTKTIAEVENVDYINMAERLDIGTVINKKKIAASHIYQMMLDADVTNVKSLTFANADVAEFNVMEGARVTRCDVKDISLPRGVTIGGLIRNGQGLMVDGSTRIEPGDHVVVFCLEGMIKSVERYFN